VNIRTSLPLKKEKKGNQIRAPREDGTKPRLIEVENGRDLAPIRTANGAGSSLTICLAGRSDDPIGTNWPRVCGRMQEKSNIVSADKFVNSDGLASAQGAL